MRQLRLQQRKSGISQQTGSAQPLLQPALLVKASKRPQRLNT
jgi:hypothetical protein